jgi:hypothetical protein
MFLFIYLVNQNISIIKTIFLLKQICDNNIMQSIQVIFLFIIINIVLFTI